VSSSRAWRSAPAAQDHRTDAGQWGVTGLPGTAVPLDARMGAFPIGGPCQRGALFDGMPGRVPPEPRGRLASPCCWWLTWTGEPGPSLGWWGALDGPGSVKPARRVITGQQKAASPDVIGLLLAWCFGALLAGRGTPGPAALQRAAGRGRRPRGRRSRGTHRLRLEPPRFWPTRLHTTVVGHTFGCAIKRRGPSAGRAPVSTKAVSRDRATTRWRD